jgi:ubiquitin C-terminal hydrolase
MDQHSIEHVLEFKKTGTGVSTFVNVGNTCYLNSALQILLHIDEIRKIFLKTEKIRMENPDFFADKDIKFYECIKAIYKGFWEDDCVIRPIGLVRYLDEHSYFPMGQQSDSTEVLTCIIQKIHESVCVPREIAEESGNNELEKASIRQWNLYLESKYSPLVNMFWGQFYTRVHCHHCGNRSKRFETFHYLTLQATIEKEENVEKEIDLQVLFKHFLDKKKFDEENKYHCDVCKKKVDEATTKTSLWKLPKFLVIQFKRYYNKPQSKAIHKCHRNISYPLEFDSSVLLDSKAPKTEGKYKLHSGIFHMGSMFGGHYNCFCWNQDTNNWIGFDDERRHNLSGPIVENNNIYQLVYQMY